MVVCFINCGKNDSGIKILLCVFMCLKCLWYLFSCVMVVLLIIVKCLFILK